MKGGEDGFSTIGGTFYAFEEHGAVDLTQILVFAIQNNASDLHLSPGHPPLIRVHSQMKRVKADPLTAESILSMLHTVMTDEQKKTFSESMQIDIPIAFGEKTRFRLNAFTTRQGTSAMFQTLPANVPSLDDLALPPPVKRFVELERGLILITGPARSGKATTLASMVGHINAKMNKHVMTFEDPVKYVHTLKKSLVHQREIGTDVSSLPRALKTMVKDDVDVVAVGRVDDRETIQACMELAEAGRLVIAAMHADTSVKVVERIIGFYPEGEKDSARTLLSHTLQGVMAQTLLRRKDGAGRVAACEVLLANSPALRSLRDGADVDLKTVIDGGFKQGMVSLDKAIHRQMALGVIDNEEMQRAMASITNIWDAGPIEDVEAAESKKFKAVSSRISAIGDVDKMFTMDEG